MVSYTPKPHRKSDRSSKAEPRALNPKPRALGRGSFAGILPQTVKTGFRGLGWGLGGMSSKPVALNPRTKDQIVMVTTLITPMKVLITLLTKSHDPPSRQTSGWRLGPGICITVL